MQEHMAHASEGHAAHSCPTVTEMAMAQRACQALRALRRALRDVARVANGGDVDQPPVAGEDPAVADALAQPVGATGTSLRMCLQPGGQGVTLGHAGQQWGCVMLLPLLSGRRAHHLSLTHLRALQGLCQKLSSSSSHMRQRRGSG